GADDGGGAVLAHAGQATDPPDVDQVLGLGQAQLHHGDEAVPAGEQLRVVLVARQEPDRLLDARDPMVLEGRRVHDAPPALLAALLAIASRPGSPPRSGTASGAGRGARCRTGPGRRGRRWRRPPWRRWCPSPPRPSRP